MNAMKAAQNMNQPDNHLLKIDILFRESFIFVLDVIRFSELLEEKNKNFLANELLSVGTNLGTLVNNARHEDNSLISLSELKKMKKNAYDTKFLLQLCKYSISYPSPKKLLNELDNLIEQIVELIRLMDEQNPLN